MAIAESTYRVISIGKQAALGTPATTGVGKSYGFRPDSSGGLSKESFESDSIRTDQQYNNPRHGLRSAPFTLSQELQIGGHQMLIEGALRAAFTTAGASTASADRAINASTRTITRTSGSFITDGFKVGDIIRCSGFTNTVNNGCNLRLSAVNALTMVYFADTWLPTLVTETAGATVTISTPGKKCQVPSTGHTKDYFTIDDFHDDIDHETKIVDARISQVSIDISPGSHAYISFQFLGTDCTYGTSQYFVAPTAAPTGALLAGPEGRLNYDGVDSAVITSVQLTIGADAQVKGVVGKNVSPDVFAMGVKVSGSLSALFDGGAVLTNFDTEKEAPLMLYLFADSTKNSEFVIIKLPNAKINQADKGTDGPAQTVSGSFSGGKLASSTTSETTSIVYHDSTAT